MSYITIHDFINLWLPPNIKYKIMSYALSSTFKFDENETFNFYNHYFVVGTHKLAFESFPFRNDSLNKNYHSPEEGSIKRLMHKSKSEMRNTLTVKKNMFTIVNNDDRVSSHDNGVVSARIIKDIPGFNNVVRSLNMEQVDRFEYVNITEVCAYKTCTGIIHTQIIRVHCGEYNNGSDRRFAIYFSNIFSELSVSPLNFLWKIRHMVISLKLLKRLAMANQIIGRSRLKTHSDYLNAFMKL